MFENLADYNFSFYYCDMRKRNHYRISKENFKQNKKMFNEILGERRYDILKLHTEKDMSYKEIAEIYDVSPTHINQIVAQSYYLIEKAGFTIEEPELDSSIDK